MVKKNKRIKQVFEFGDWVALVVRKPHCARCARKFQPGDNGVHAWDKGGKPEVICMPCSRKEDQERLGILSQKN